MEFIHRKLKNPKRLGEILKDVRQKRNITLEQAEEEIKVRVRYLQALEDGRYEILPESVYTLGFLAKYADFLGLNRNAMLAKFNSERGTTYKNTKIMVQRRIKEPLFNITPRFLVITGIILALVGIGGYIVYSVHSFMSPPNLAISAPNANQIIQADSVDIIGKTDEGASLSINGQSVATDDLGNFHQQVKLQPGLNSFEIQSINQLKKESVKTISVEAEIQSIVPVSTVSPMPSMSISPSATPKASKSASASPSASPSIKK